MDEIQDVRKQMAELEWWHRIDLGNGLFTPGRDQTEEKLKTLHLPGSMKGQSVMDVGAWDGFFSFEAEKRGVKRVLALDRLAWEREARSGRPCFNFARSVLSSQ
ncbi:MAG: hypothetical protein ACHQ49_14585 [Elusimicrobiota bacterium]